MGASVVDLSTTSASVCSASLGRLRPFEKQSIDTIIAEVNSFGQLVTRAERTVFLPQMARPRETLAPFSLAPGSAGQGGGWPCRIGDMLGRDRPLVVGCRWSLRHACPPPVPQARVALDISLLACKAWTVRAAGAQPPVWASRLLSMGRKALARSPLEAES
jgi:hypothetical protein